MVRRNAYVHDIRSNEANLRVTRGVFWSEDHLGLAACGSVRVVGVDEHEIEEVHADVLVEHP
jgi:hypothetical protein